MVMTSERVKVAIKSSMCITILKKLFEIAKEANAAIINRYYRIFERDIYPASPKMPSPLTIIKWEMKPGVLLLLLVARVIVHIVLSDLQRGN